MVRIELTLTIMSCTRSQFILLETSGTHSVVSSYTNSTFLSATGILLVAV